MERETLVGFLKDLQNKITAKFETYENTARFKSTPWDYRNGAGGGEMKVLLGNSFEKAAVNFSAVSGDTFPMADGLGPFFATGVSLITHMANPLAPTVHMNIRYIETKDRFWFGGGYDLTPMGFPFEEDTKHFHSVAKKTLDPFGQEIYPLFSKQAKEYFYIPHRQKERGVGGIFFDHYNTGNPVQDLKLWQSVGLTFLDAICPILDRRLQMPYTEDQKETQLQMRSHYVEFNLLYDRGTKFGFASGGNPDAILCSMPPVVKWNK